MSVFGLFMGFNDKMKKIIIIIDYLCPLSLKGQLKSNNTFFFSLICCAVVVLVAELLNFGDRCHRDLSQPYILA